MFPRLEVVGAKNEEEEERSREKAEFHCKEFLRDVYYKHYKKWSVLTICVFLGNSLLSGDIKQKIFLPAIGGILVLLGQWSLPHWELAGLSFLTVGVSLCVLRCVLHYASLSQRRKVLPYIGWVNPGFTVRVEREIDLISGSGSATELRTAGCLKMKYSGEKPASGAPVILSPGRTISFENIYFY